MSPTLSRRGFLAATGAAGLVLGFELPLGAKRAEAGMPGGTVVNGFLRIGPDGAVTIYTATTEIGQGTGSTLAQAVAEELEVEYKHVRVEMAPIEPAYFIKPFGGAVYATFGSMGTYSQFEPLRRAAGAARMMMLQAAATRWGVNPEDCVARYGVVKHPPSERLAGYGELAPVAALLTPPSEVPLKAREQWSVIGRPMPRLDTPAKVDGSAEYGIDFSLPGLLVATIAQCPVFGGTLGSVDPAPALKVRGVRKVVRLENAVAVVATGWWAAKKGLDALSPAWNAGPNAGHSSADYAGLLREAAGRGEAVFAAPGQDPAKIRADHDAALAGAVRRVEAVYEAPFLDHAPMEPMNGTARVTRDGVELWLATQNQSVIKDMVAKQLGIAPEKVVIHTMPAGGGFGRRIEIDYVRQVVEIARQVGQPVKLIWSREEDMTHGFYRPAAAARIMAGLGPDGMPVALRFDAACESLLDHSVQGQKGQRPPVDFIGLMYAAKPPYAFPGYMARLTKAEYGVPVGFWRSVGTSQNCFFLESFTDELAAEAKLDPVEYRRRLLKHLPRELAVLEKAAAAGGWGKAAPGRHQGVALSRGNGSVVAAVVELSVTDGAVKLHRMTGVIDCGIAGNPGNIRQQVEGGLIFGLSAALFGEITLKDGAVEQRNFDAYPLLTLAQTPAIDVHILETGERMGGVGEEAVPVAAPAVANALFAATGKRLRVTPFAKAGLSFV
ncbi:MAG TPA: molybdopterin cofactor-binding domain-containing protein [Azospirillaceae bacterium]|nr:molybdopterin cofactor-binding domain-containing protein [Azospirillaceae bacterium]